MDKDAEKKVATEEMEKPENDERIGERKGKRSRKRIREKGGDNTEK